MSTQRGNTTRSRPQKHKNKTVFRNDLHDTNQRTKFINNIKVNDVCQRCKEIIEWKIKYKKYKPLTQPKKCVKCEQKTVRKAYHVMCTDCGRKLGACTKCCQTKEIMPTELDQHEPLKLDGKIQQMLQSLPERKRRTFLRYMAKKKKEINIDINPEEQKNDLISKLNALKVDDAYDENSDFSSCESDDDDEDEF